METPMYELEIAALREQLRLEQESRNFWRWAAIALGVALGVAVATALKGGC